MLLAGEEMDQPPLRPKDIDTERTLTPSVRLLLKKADLGCLYANGAAAH